MGQRRQAVATAATRVGAVCTVVHVEISAEAEVSSTPAAFAPASAAARPQRQALEAVLRDQAEARGRIAAGDALSGVVGAALAARAAREALRRPEAEGARFSLGTGGDGGGDGDGVGGGWDDEFLKLVGPEIARFGAAAVPVAWVRDWARALQSSPDGQGGALLSRFVVLDLPTAASLAAAKRGDGASLPSGVRIRFLASGVEYVDEKEELRVKGDFDGAIDVYVEAGRVRMVRAEMEGVWRRGTDGSRRQVAPLVKVSSEARLLKKLEVDLREDGWLS